jgi:heat shock protein HtpX
MNLYSQIAANRNKTIWLVTLFLAVVIAFGYLLSIYYSDFSILLVAVLFSVFSSWGSYYFSDKLVLTQSGARPIDVKNPSELEIDRLVENVSIEAGLPKPRVYIVEDRSPNAFATGRNPHHSAIALTSGLIDILDKTELEGVIAHELSHVKNYDILLSTIVVTLLGFIALASDWFLRFNLGRRNDNDQGGGNALALVGLALAILAPIFLQLMNFAISRKREFLADASGAMITRYPEGLASALSKISAAGIPLRRANRATAHLYFTNPFRVSQDYFAKITSTHPPVKERIEALIGKQGA